MKIHLIVFILLSIISIGCVSNAKSGGVVIDEIIFEHPGYSITIKKNGQAKSDAKIGQARIDYLLNQQGIDRQSIESGFGGYPTEKFKEVAITQNDIQRIFNEFESSDLTNIKEEYLAPKGSFESYGHAVVMQITLKSDNKLIKNIKFDSSRQKDWPVVINNEVKNIYQLALQSSFIIPKGPFIN